MFEICDEAPGESLKIAKAITQLLEIIGPVRSIAQVAKDLLYSLRTQI